MVAPFKQGGRHPKTQARVRMFYAATSFSPLSLFTNGEQGAWYDPSDLSTLYQDAAGTTPVTADGDPVGLMLDKSGNGAHASQATATRRSLYDTQTINPDGVDDYYGLGQALNHEQFSVSAVCRVGGENQRLVDNRGIGAYGTEPGWHLKARNSTGDLAMIGDNSGKYISWSNNNGGINYKPAIGETVVLTLQYSPTDASFRINGIDQGPPDRGTGIGSIGSIISPVDGNLFTASNSIGQQSFNGAFIGCVIINRYLSTAEIEQVESYLASKAGVTL